MPVTGCYFLPLVDERGKHQVICAHEVEEITTVAETRLPPWAREVFPSVRVHMPWMDTPASPIELLIGLDNMQWLPVHLEDSREQSVNMQLMKSSFGHQFMVMGGLGTALYPRDKSMRFWRDPSGGRLSHAEMAQKVRLERYIGGRLHLGARDGGRAAIRGPSPARGRAAPDYGPVGSRRPQQPRRGAPTPHKDAFQSPACANSTGAGPGWGHQTSATEGAAPSQPPRNARTAAATRAGGSDAETGPHDGRDGDGAGHAAGAQLPCQHKSRDIMGQRHGGAKDLPTGHGRKREWDLGSGGAVGPEPLEETASRALPSDPIHPLVHVRIRWPNEDGEV